MDADYAGAATTYGDGSTFTDADSNAVARAVPTDCAKGYYCPAANATQDPAAVETICADGSYSWNANLIDQDDCTPCPIGKYCKSADVVSLIAAGSWDGSWEGENCLAGFYCPMGSYFDEGTDELVEDSDSDFDPDGSEV